MDADRWKAWEHDRWMTAPGKPGVMQLFGEGSEPGQRLTFDEQSHFSYAKHICSEVEVEEVIKGALVRRWKNKSDNNHYLDASYMANVAANIKGVRLLREQPVVTQKQATPPLVPQLDPTEVPFLASAR